MSITGREYMLIKQVEEAASRLGMKIAISNSRHDLLCLMPANNELPVYSRDAELAAGSIEYLDSVIQGWQKAYQYYSTLGLVTESKIKKAENMCEQKRLFQLLKTKS